ncbi:MAG: DUF4830 domain-containing protein [Oscillospiraceae bacterium]|nr:DUF4830 domain-containing protein [Oscillospiraceae bacterium]
MKKYLTYLLILQPALLCIIAVIFSHQKKQPPTDNIKASTEFDRHAWLLTQGWNAELLHSRAVTIPFDFDNSNYQTYANLQIQQRLPLENYAGKRGVLYTYQLENSPLYAELLTADGILIGAQCYLPEESITLDMQGKEFKIN